MNTANRLSFPKSVAAWDILNSMSLTQASMFPVVTLKAFVELLTEWNSFASLLSRRAIAEEVDAHIADSFSLLPYIIDLDDVRWLDVGSGGGFPAIPCKIVRPDLHITMIERRSRKVAFLRKVVTELGLDSITIVQGSFPADAPDGEHNRITARAVERPEVLHKSMMGFMGDGSVFLCQSPRELSTFAPGAVHLVDDAFSASGLRRGSLRLVRRVSG